MKIIAINKISHNLKMKRFKMPNAPYSTRWVQPEQNTVDKNIKGKYENRKSFN